MKGLCRGSLAEHPRSPTVLYQPEVPYRNYLPHGCSARPPEGPNSHLTTACMLPLFPPLVSTCFPMLEAVAAWQVATQSALGAPWWRGVRQATVGKVAIFRGKGSSLKDSACHSQDSPAKLRFSPASTVKCSVLLERDFV